MAAANEPLGYWISDQALAEFKTSRDEAMELKLCAGLIVGLDLDTSKGKRFLARWGQLAGSGLFVTSHSKHCPDSMRSVQVSDTNEALIMSKDPRFKGHRSDEACFSLMMRDLGIKTVHVDELNLTIRSGYDIEAD